MTTPSIGQARYEFWRWEYQRRNQGYRDAIDTIVALKEERIKLGLVDANATPSRIFRANEPNDHYRLLCDNPYIEGVVLLECRFLPFLTPSEIIAFIKEHCRIPEHYCWGSSGEELIETILLGNLSDELEQPLFHIPTFHVDYDTDALLEGHINLRIPVEADTELVLLEVAYLHGLNKFRGTADFVMPDDDPNTYQRAFVPAYVEALDALRVWWQKKRSYKRATFSATWRAVGLWLYDFAIQFDAPPTKAANAFLEQYQDDTGDCSLGKQLNDEHLLMDLLAKSRQCIEEIEVLPMKKGRRK